MKKRILAVVLSICALFSMVVVTNAANASIDSNIVITKKLCPGEYINDSTIAAPEYSGAVFAKGWEIKAAGSNDWVPYEGQALAATDNGSTLRYFVATYSGDYVYSNECELTVKHNPEGPYRWDGSTHWRFCIDCDQVCEEEYHSFFDKASDPSTNKVTICKVCGAEKTAQWRGLAAFWSWLMNLLTTLIG